MERSTTPEISRNIFLKHIFYPVSSSFLSSSLSSLPLFELFNTMSQIKKKIKNDIDDDGSDREIEIDDTIEDTRVNKQSIDRHSRIRYKL